MKLITKLNLEENLKSFLANIIKPYINKELEEAAPVQKLYAYHNNGEDDKGEATWVYGDANIVYFKKVVDSLKDYEMLSPQGSEGYEIIQKDTVAVTRVFDENYIIFEIGDNRCCYYREESSDIEL